LRTCCGLWSKERGLRKEREARWKRLHLVTQCEQPPSPSHLDKSKEKDESNTPHAARHMDGYNNGLNKTIGE